MTEHLAPAPTAFERVKELLIHRFGLGGCRHQWMVVTRKDRMYLRCTKCPQETEGFRVAGKRDS